MRALVIAVLMLLIPACDGTGAGDETIEVVQRHHAYEITLTGPDLSVDGMPNPFLDTRMDVRLIHDTGVEQDVFGHFAADGNAADTLATSGNVWRAVARPSLEGDWEWTATLHSGDGVALQTDGEVVAIQTGRFRVTSSDAVAPDFRAIGLLRATDSHLSTDDGPWLKLGTNSPENWLGYDGFTNTYRIADNDRDGESTAGLGIHSFAPYRVDAPADVPTWAGDSRGILGAAHYLAGQGLNAVYMLTYNVEGDGKDVWPWLEPDNPTRFDVAKLAQWERAIAHFNHLGISVQLVLQETENELILDGGDTGPERQLYFREIVSRLGHLPGVVYNLGEENGPVTWRPEGQTDAQRLAMIDYLDRIDGYDRPILIHTHSKSGEKDLILSPLLGIDGLDGLSFQVSTPEDVPAETSKWLDLARASGRPWLITMDEIGPWHTGAVSDGEVDDDRDALRRHALWGHLLAGGAGVEWYAGARNVGNDLTTEDFRLREGLWAMTRVAGDILRRDGLFGLLTPCPVADHPIGTCAQNDTHRIVYIREGEERNDRSDARLYDAMTGTEPGPQTRDIIAVEPL